MSQVPLFAFVVLGVVTLAGLACLADRVLLWMERRGWIYYRNFEPRIKDGVRGVIGTFQEIVEPQIRQVKEERSQRLAETDDAVGSDR